VKLSRVVAVVLLAGCGGFAHAAPPRQTLRVFAAASLADAFGDLARLLEKERPGLVVRTNFAGSQQLAAQLEQGAQADVFAAADERWMDRVRALGLVAGEPAIFARNWLVAIVPATNPARIRSLRDLARGGVKVVLGADAVPVGHYSRIALRNLSQEPGFDRDFGARVLKNVVSEEENVKSVVGKVQLGEADAGICYRSDVTASVARYVHVLEIPETANVPAAYPIAVLAGSPAADLARAFVDLARSPAGQAVLAKRGFLPVAP